MFQIFLSRTSLNSALNGMFACLPTSLSLRKHSTEWKILKGIRTTTLDCYHQKEFYELFECSVILENTLPESFPIKSRVQQSFTLSPIFFVVAIDWVISETTCYDSIVLFFASYTSRDTILCNPDLVVKCALLDDPRLKAC